jgi:hypothetical protein
MRLRAEWASDRTDAARQVGVRVDGIDTESGRRRRPKRETVDHLLDEWVSGKVDVSSMRGPR